MIISILIKNLKHKNSDMAATELVTRATKKWKLQQPNYRDDITVIVAYFNCEDKDDQ